MGSNSITTMSYGCVLAGIVIFYFAPNIFDSVIEVLPVVGLSEKTVKDFLAEHHPNYQLNTDGATKIVPKDKNTEKSKIRLFTKEELSKYDGSPDSEGLYLALLGEVFDVSKGAQHYKPGSGYSFFAGRDASRAYITGDFQNAENADDVSDLDDPSLVSLSDWLSFYREEYTFIGNVIGRYYDDKGKPTALKQSVQEKVETSQSNKWTEDNEKTMFPPCNSEWSKEIGSRVWCSKMSGGVERDWAGVPRQLYKSGKDPRCVCVRDSGPPTNHRDGKKHSDLGDLENPNLHEYPDCPKNSVTCQVNHP